MKSAKIEPVKLDTPEILNAIFVPRKESKTALPPSCAELAISVSENGPVLGCRFHISEKEAPVILYFHGNGEIVSDYDNIGRSFAEAGLNLMVATYRGYGWSEGVPTVSALYNDNIAILEFICKYNRLHNLTGPLFSMGRSLGSASAIDLVFHHDEKFKGLIIDSGFAETLPLARRLGFDTTAGNISEEDCFNNLSKIKMISTPTLILHGARDQLIPVAEAEKLQAESGARTKQFHVIPGADHNSLIENGGRLYFETIKSFTDAVTGQNTWRQRRRKFNQQRNQ